MTGYGWVLCDLTAPAKIRMNTMRKRNIKVFKRQRALRLEQLEVRKNMSFAPIDFNLAPPEEAVDDSFTVKIDSTDNPLLPLSNDRSSWWWRNPYIDAVSPTLLRSQESAQRIAIDSVWPPITNDATKIVSVTTPKHGQVQISDDQQSVYYTPDAGFEGIDQFDYEINSDQPTQKLATVSLNVVAPLLAIDDWFLSKPVNTSLDLDVLKNDQFNAAEFNNEEAKNQFKIVSVTTPSAGGTVRIDDNGRSLIYSAANGFEGIERISYTLEDKDGYRDTAQVSIRVSQSTTANEETWPEQVRQQWLEEIIKRNVYQFGTGTYQNYYYPGLAYDDRAMLATSVNASTVGNGAQSLRSSSSDTNNQVAGVDEGDIVETDGRYVYIFSNSANYAPFDNPNMVIGRVFGQQSTAVSTNDLVIIDAIDPKSPKVVSRLSFTGSLLAQHLSGDRLAVITNDSNKTMVTIVDLADHASPKVVRSSAIDGNFQQSRMIGDKLYVFASSYIQPQQVEQYTTIDGLKLFNETGHQFLARLGEKLYDGAPILVTNFDAVGKQVGDSRNILTLDEALKAIRANYSVQGIYSFDVDASQSGPFDIDTFTSTFASTIFVSTKAAYFFETQWGAFNIFQTQELNSLPVWISRVSTSISSFSFDPLDGSVNLSATGSLDGSLLNSFSVGEYKEDLQVFTSNGPDGNKLSILRRDGTNLKEIGAIKQIAPGETIYSARLTGEHAYAVTFRRVDPLFVLDLSNPVDPKIAGELKLPGYSQYLHVIDDTHLLGIGRDSNEQSGLYEGLQVSLFDISDIRKPTLQSKYEFEGGRRTFSPLLESAFGLSDHHALGYFDEPEILALPLSHHPDWWNRTADENVKEDDLPEVDVLRITTKTGITSLGGIQSPTSVKRTVQIGDYLYSIADDRVIVTDLLKPSVIHAELLLPKPTVIKVEPSKGGGNSGGTIVTKIDPVINIVETKVTEKPFEWHNHKNRFDVNGDGDVAPIDVLNVINFLKSHGSGSVADLEKPMRDRQKAEGLTAEVLFQVDVDGDGEIAPLDVLLVINQLRAASQRNGEGESRSMLSNDTNIETVPSNTFESGAVDNAFASWDNWERKRQR